MALVAGVAVADEFIQSRIPWRTGLVSDVFLDFGAAALAVGLARARSGEGYGAGTPATAGDVDPAGTD